MEVDIYDAGGRAVKYTQLEDGRLLPSFDLEILKSVPNIKLRKDDTLLCAYTKSGTHWLFQVISLLIQGGVGNDCHPDSKMDFMLEHNSNFEAIPSPRVLNSHYRFQDLPTDIHAVKPKIIYIRRNPKDVVVSLYHHTYNIPLYGYKGKFHDFLRLFVEGRVDYGSWFDYVKDWENIMESNEFDILSLTYEDLKQDTLQEIKKINDFLGLKRSDELMESIKDMSSFKSMSAKNGHKLISKEGRPVMYRKGEVGDWKNWFTVADSEWFDSIYRQNMNDSKLEFKYE